jgi:hypothetical protein
MMFFPKGKRSGAAQEGFIRLKEIKFPIQSRDDLAAIPPDLVDELAAGPAWGADGDISCAAPLSP